MARVRSVLEDVAPVENQRRGRRWDGSPLGVAREKTERNDEPVGTSGRKRVQRRKPVSTAQPTLNFIQYNAEQLEAINHGEGPMIVYACPGSGKSQSMVGRIIRLVEDEIEQSKILATTFTVKAAGELNERLDARNIKDVRVCTLHSLCNSLIREYTQFVQEKWKVDDHDIYNLIILKDVISYKQMNWKHCDLSLVQEFISLCKANLVRPEKVRDFQDWRNAPFFGDDRYVKAYFLAEEERLKRKLITFDDMLIDAVELLQRNRVCREKIQEQYEWVIVDEAQDSNVAQVTLVDLIAPPQWNLTVVGDIDQCQPAGTKVKTANGEKNIEDLTVRDYVSIWSPSTGKESGIRQIQEISKHEHNSGLLEITTVGKNDVYQTLVTQDHKFTVRFNYDIDRWVVYMMYRSDLGFRIGWCKLFAEHKGEKKSFHFAKRARLEKADCAWIVNVCETPRIASLNESIIATNFGLPLVPFEPSLRAKNYDVDGIKFMFRCFRNLDKKAADLFENYGLKFEYPFYSQSQIQQKGGYHLLTTAACNLYEEIMLVPTVEGWLPIKNIALHYDFEKESTPVYSLQVEQAHNYIADGIGVNNCIYEWRSAKPGLFLNFADRVKKLSGLDAKVVTLPMNYRSRPQIVERAAKCIVHNENRVPISFKTHKTEPATIKFRAAADQDDEAEIVLSEVKMLLESGFRPGDMKVMYRVNAQSRAIEEVFQREHIPHVVLGGGCFYERKEVQDVLSYLKLLVNPEDFDSGFRAMSRPFRFIGIDAIREIEKERGDGTDFISAVKMVASTSQKYGRQLLAFVRDIENIIAWIGIVLASEKKQPSVGEILSKIVSDTRIIDYMISNEGSDTVENSVAANIGEVIRSASRYTSITEFLEFVSWQIEQRKKNKEKKNAIQVSTIHKQKGLEAKAVFVIGVNDGILPHANGELEEERRLYYVAITRAEEYLHLSSITALGMTNKALAPSIFLAESDMLPIADGE